MRLNDLMRVSVRQVIRHRRRYMGVMLAIALGVAGFLNIVTMTREVKNNFNENLNLIGGVNIIRIYFDNARSYRPQWFREQTLAALKQLDGVKELTLTFARPAHATWRGQNFGFNAIAVDGNFWQVRNFWPLTGKLFGLDAVNERKREVVLGAELAKRIFGDTQVRGRTLEINREIFQVAGVLGGVTDSGLANSLYLPITTAEDRFTGRLLADRLYLRCNTWDDVAGVVAAIPGIVETYQSPEELHVEVSWEALKRVQQLAWWIEFLIYLATSATFLLGGVGIWNVMMAAVTSRTREIGLKKAMGAEDRDIMLQFLSEAFCLSGLAALLGAGLGRILMEVLSFIIGTRPSEDLFFFGLTLAFLFAVLIGVGAGLYPSLRASRMEVVSAIRYE
ncbi:MAG: ABC transporter permease [Thermodesulfobacteriota bacterium]